MEHAPLWQKSPAPDAELPHHSPASVSQSEFLVQAGGSGGSEGEGEGGGAEGGSAGAGEGGGSEGEG